MLYKHLQKIARETSGAASGGLIPIPVFRFGDGLTDVLFFVPCSARWVFRDGGEPFGRTSVRNQIKPVFFRSAQKSVCIVEITADYSLIFGSQIWINLLQHLVIMVFLRAGQLKAVVAS